MGKRKTQVIFEKEVYELVGEDYTVLGNYEKSSIKLQIRHNKCNHDYLVAPNSFLRGTRCPNCFGTPKKSTEWFKEEVYKLVKNEYQVAGEYEGRDKKIKIFHTECGKEFMMRPNHFIERNHRCPHCSKLKNKTDEQFKKEVNSLVGEEYIVIGKYINNRSMIELKHAVCGNSFKMRASTFVNDGQRCPECANNIKKSNEEFQFQVLELVRNEYAFIGIYENAISKMNIRHNTCGNEYLVSPNKFLNGRRCPFCNESKGEIKIKNYLNSNIIKYNRQYSFNDCRNKNPLPFDFAIFNDQDNLHCLIEYDGKQHFKSVEFFGGESSFKQRKINDSIKDEYCYVNGIKLIRIPYWDFNRIEEILKVHLVSNKT